VAGCWRFNLIYQAADKNNANLDRAMMGRFRRFLDDTEVKEIPLLGRKYTWSNERRCPTLVRLDRAFCCIGWENIFPDSVLQSAASTVSDHCLLILGLKAQTVVRDVSILRVFGQRFRGSLRLSSRIGMLLYSPTVQLNACS